MKRGTIPKREFTVHFDGPVEIHAKEAENWRLVNGRDGECLILMARSPDFRDRVCVEEDAITPMREAD